MRNITRGTYDERYVIPAGHAESAHDLEGIGSECPLNFNGGGKPIGLFPHPERE